MELARTGSLELFPKADQLRERWVSAAAVTANAALGVLVVLRDVRDRSCAIDDRRQWLDGAVERSRSFSPYEWYDVGLAIVRHAALVGRDELACVHASSLVDTMLAAPPADAVAQCSQLRDGLWRAVQAMRVAVLARTLRLAVSDRTHEIIEVACADRTTLDVSRLAPIAQLFAAQLVLSSDVSRIATLVIPALRAPTLSPMVRDGYGDTFVVLASEAAPSLVAELAQLLGARPPLAPRDAERRKRDLLAPFAVERARSYIASPVYSWARPPITGW